MHTRFAGLRRVAALLLIAAGGAGCGIGSQEPPGFIGPSGFGQSVTLNAVPDRLPRDGQSQSVVTVSVHNDSGQPVSGQRVTVGASSGTLSQAEIVTGSDGRASFTLTAPQPASTGNTIEVFATAVAGNFDNAITRSLSIAVLGLSNATEPTPQFTVSPQNPGALETVTFDASGTTDEGETCAAACTYVWTMGDGTTKTGKIITHIFGTPGAYTVLLTVTDAVGTTATRQLVLVVGSVAAPSISALAVAPDPVEVGKQATLTATATAAAGHAIARYAWSFGDGTTATTTSPTANKTWESAGVYVVTVTATDDLGQSSSRSLQVSVRTVPAPTVTLSVTPNPPLAGQQATFLANASPAAGHSITRYEWTFGDGTSQTTTVPSVTKTYTTQGVYVVTVTVTDDSGQTGSVSQQMNIANSAVNATISYSPKDPVLGQSVIFTALNPTAPNGATITSYEWNFGDPGSGNNTETGRTVSHTFSSANTFVVQLKVTDSSGGIGLVTIEVSVTAPAGP